MKLTKSLTLVVFVMLVSCTPKDETIVSAFTQLPPGWSPYTEPLLNYKLWLPPDWKAELDVYEGVDLIDTSLYRPSDNELYGTISIGLIDPYGFNETRRYPSKFVTFSGEPYQINIETASIPCARYEVGWYTLKRIVRVNHVCVLGIYHSDQFGLVGELREKDVLFVFITDEISEPSLIYEWKQIVVSFYLEQPPIE